MLGKDRMMPQDQDLPKPLQRHMNPARRPQSPSKGLLQRVLERLGIRRKGREKKNDPNIYPLY